MFRKQKFYSEKYPELEEKIIADIENVLENKELLDNDDNYEQEEIQRAEPATLEDIKYSSNKSLNIVKRSQGNVIAKDSKISKSALIEAKYVYAINQTHKTFITTRNVSYMEGHYLISCTMPNSEYFMEKLKKT